MTRGRYLVGPCLCQFAAWAIANGTVSLIPLYAVERGASAAEVGVFMAIGFGFLSAGTLLPGLLSRKASHARILLCAGGAVWALAGLVISWTTTLRGYEAALLGAFFCSGLVLNQAAVLTGLSAPEGERGAAMGVLAASGSLGSMVGALVEGWVADRCGFSAVFQSCALFAVPVIVGGLVSVRPPSAARAARAARGAPPAPPGTVDQPPVRSPRPASVLGAALLLLVASQVLMAVTNSSATLGRSLAMDRQGFSRLALNSTLAASSAVSLVLPLTLGWLSDRVGRRWIMAGTCLASGAGLVVLAFAGTLWQFYVFAVLNAFLSVPSAVGQALVIDVVTRESAGRGVSLFQAGSWAGNIGGMLVGGLAIGALGIAPSMLGCTGLTAAAAIVILLIRPRKPASTVAGAAAGARTTASR